MDDTVKKLREMGAIFNIFEYDDSNRSWCSLDDSEKDRLAKEQHCQAVTKQGHHAKKADGSDILCSECQRCYRKTGKTTAVYDH